MLLEFFKLSIDISFPNSRTHSEAISLSRWDVGLVGMCVGEERKLEVGLCLIVAAREI